MNGAVDAAAAQERRIGGVHDCAHASVVMSALIARRMAAIVRIDHACARCP
jgi:hypothetical protein